MAHSSNQHLFFVLDEEGRQYTITVSHGISDTEVVFLGFGCGRVYRPDFFDLSTHYRRDIYQYGIEFPFLFVSDPHQESIV